MLIIFSFAFWSSVFSCLKKYLLTSFAHFENWSILGGREIKANLMFLFGFASQNSIYFQGVCHSGPMRRGACKWQDAKRKGGER